MTNLQLFNIKNDHREEVNLANIDANHTNITTVLLNKLRAYQMGMIPAIDDDEDLVACDPGPGGTNKTVWGPYTV